MIRDKIRPLRECAPTAVANFQHSTYGPPHRRAVIRTRALDQLRHNQEEQDNAVTWLPQQNREDFWSSTDKSAFVLCPAGNGLDTHRAWETLILGRVPVLTACPMNAMLFRGLPHVEVEDWSVLTTPGFLAARLNEILSRWNVYEFDRLHLQRYIRFH
jgi:hypothetical protein